MKFATITVLCCCLSFTGCPPATPSSTLTALEASVAAAEVVVATLAATGKIDMGTAVMIEAAIAPLPGVFQETVAEMSSMDTDAMKAIKITGYFEPVLKSLNALPPTAQVWVTAVVSSIRAFLAYYPMPQAGAKLKMDRHVTKFDPTRLSTIALRAGLIESKLKTLSGK